jgi:hypothetical protein
MANTFAFAECRDGALRKVALEAVTAARQAAEAAGGGEVHALLVEIDMGTVRLERMWRRYRGYWRLWSDGVARLRWGDVPQRVLTLSTTPRRLEALRHAAARAPENGRRGSGLFWFAPLDVADLQHPERFLAPVWTTASEPPLSSQSLFT